METTLWEKSGGLHGQVKMTTISTLEGELYIIGAFKVIEGP